jgi:uncharacterized paraquat-inducible protein A
MWHSWSYVERMRVRLVDCPDCDHPVSRDAVACPSCGRPLKGLPRSPAMALLDIAAIVLMCVVLVPLGMGLLALAAAELPRALAVLVRLF